MPEPSRRRRLLILAICCMSLFIFGLDNTIVNVALPSIQHDLHAPVSGLQWTVDAYTLVVASFLILAGSTADRFGRRRIFQIGLATFTLGSLLCSLAPEPRLAGRVPDAAGDRRLDAQPGGHVHHHQHLHRPSASAPAPSASGAASSAWPWRPARCVGGALVATVGWRGIFWVNIPIGVAAIVLTALFVPESRAARPRRLDPAGQVLIIATLASLTYAIIEGPRHGWLSPEILGLFDAVGRRPRRPARLRAAARRATAGPEILPQRAVLRRLTDRDQRSRRPGRLPVPQHAVPAGRARLLGPARRAVHPAAGRGDRAISRRCPGGSSAAVAPGCRWLVAGLAMTAGGVLLTSLTPTTSDRLPDARLRDPRHRVRHGQRRRSPTPRCPACPAPRRAWRRPSPRPAGRSA